MSEGGKLTTEQVGKLKELELRRGLAQIAIQTLDRMDRDDARVLPAMETYKEQLASIDRQIAEITGKPPAVVVGLKPAKLVGKAGKG